MARHLITGLTDKQLARWEETAEVATRVALRKACDAGADLISQRPVTAAAGDVDPYDLAVVDQAWRDEVDNTLLPMMSEVWRDSEGTVQAGLIEASARYVPDPPSAAQLAHLAQLGPILDDIGADAWGHAQIALADGVALGESIPQLAERVRQSSNVTARKAVLAARTAVISTANHASIDTARASGLPMRKQWSSSMDGRVRATHIRANGQLRDLNEPFTVGGESADYPGDPGLSPAERYSCRCTTLYVFDDDEPPLPVPGDEPETITGQPAPPPVPLSDGLDDLLDHQLRGLALEYEIPTNRLGDRAGMLQALRAAGAKAPHIRDQDAFPIRWQYPPDDSFVAGSDLIPDVDAAGATMRRWVYDKPVGLGRGTEAQPMVNAALRGLADMTPERRGDVEILDRLIAASASDRPTTVYRGYTIGDHILPDGWEDRDLTGLEWDDPGFLSVTDTLDSAEAYAGDAARRAFVIEMRLPAGHHGLSVVDRSQAEGFDFDSSLMGLDDEGEIILPRGTRLRVVEDKGFQEPYGIRHLVVEPVDDPRGAPAKLPDLTEAPAPKSAQELIDKTTAPTLTRAEQVETDIHRLWMANRDPAEAAAKTDYVWLSDIRAGLPDVPRAEVDTALREMATKPGVNIVPTANLKAISPMFNPGERAKWDAAVRIGGEDAHLIRFDPIYKPPRVMPDVGDGKMFETTGEGPLQMGLPDKQARRGLPGQPAPRPSGGGAPRPAPAPPDLKEARKRFAEASKESAKGREALRSVPIRMTQPGNEYEFEGLDAIPSTNRARAKRAITQYSRGAFVDVNDYLRTGEVKGTSTVSFSKAEVQDMISGLDEAFDHSHLTRPVTVYRGTGRELLGLQRGVDLPDDLTGHEWSELGYSSTTADKRVAQFFGDGDIQLRVVVPEGHRALVLSDMGRETEAEILLPRGMRYRVVKDRGVVDGKRTLDVEIVPEGAPPAAAPVEIPARPSFGYLRGNRRKEMEQLLADLDAAGEAGSEFGFGHLENLQALKSAGMVREVSTSALTDKTIAGRLQMGGSTRYFITDKGRAELAALRGAAPNPLAKMSVGELRTLAKAEGADLPAKGLKKDIIAAIERNRAGGGELTQGAPVAVRRVDEVFDSAADIADATFDLDPNTNLQLRAQARQRFIDRKRALGETLIRIVAADADGADLDVLDQLLASFARRGPGVPDEVVTELRAAIASGDRARLAATISRIAAAEHLELDDVADDATLVFDPKWMQMLGGGRPSRADHLVHPVRPGLSIVEPKIGTIEDPTAGRLRLSRTVVEDATDAEARPGPVERALLAGEEEIPELPEPPRAVSPLLQPGREVPAELVRPRPDAGAFERAWQSARTGDDALGAAAVPLKTAAERKAYAAYVSDYRHVNRALRDNGGVIPDGRGFAAERRLQAGLDSAMQRSGLTDDVAVYRIGGTVEFDNGVPTVGAEWTDYGYVSTASRPKLGAGRGEVSMRIVVPRGTRAVSTPELDANEILLDRGQTFRVVRVNGPDERGVWQVDVELVRAAPPPPPAAAPLPVSTLEQFYTAMGMDQVEQSADQAVRLIYDALLSAGRGGVPGHPNAVTLDAIRAELPAMTRADVNSVIRYMARDDNIELGRGGEVRGAVTVDGEPIQWVEIKPAGRLGAGPEAPPTAAPGLIAQEATTAPTVVDVSAVEAQRAAMTAKQLRDVLRSLGVKVPPKTELAELRRLATHPSLLELDTNGAVSIDGALGRLSAEELRDYARHRYQRVGLDLDPNASQGAIIRFLRRGRNGGPKEDALVEAFLQERAQRVAEVVGEAFELLAKGAKPSDIAKALKATVRGQLQSAGSMAGGGGGEAAQAELAAILDAIKAGEAADRLDAIARRYGLARIGRTTETVPFDPAKHAAISADIRPGDSVTIIRPGWTVDQPTGPATIVKADVGAASINPEADAARLALAAARVAEDAKMTKRFGDISPLARRVLRAKHRSEIYDIIRGDSLDEAGIRALAAELKIQIPSDITRKDKMLTFVSKAIDAIPGRPARKSILLPVNDAERAAAARALTERAARAPKILDLLSSTDTDFNPEASERLRRAFAEVLEGEYPGGLRIVDVSAHQLGDVFSFGGAIQDAAGEIVGYFDRFAVRHNGKWKEIHHHKFFLDPEVQGSGLANMMNRAMFDWYRRSGFKDVTVGASDIGSYTWAAQGFDFASRQALSDFLDQDMGSMIWDSSGIVGPSHTSAEYLRQQKLLEALLERARRGEWVSAYEFSQVGRKEGQGKLDWWIGKEFMLRKGGFSGKKKL